jgi:hypothetical protein
MKNKGLKYFKSTRHEKSETGIKAWAFEKVRSG